MSMALSAKNKLGFVNGSLPKPSDSADSHFNPWLRCNKMVISWLLNSVSTKISSNILYIATTYEIWSDLKKQFSHKNGPRIFHLQKSISFLTQGSLSLSNYFTRLKDLWDELSNYKSIPACSCGVVWTLNSYIQQERILQFLVGLNESFAPAHAHILLMEPLPSLNKVFSLVLQEEQQREISSVSFPSDDSHVFSSHLDNTRSVKSF